MVYEYMVKESTIPLMFFVIPLLATMLCFVVRGNRMLSNLITITSATVLLILSVIVLRTVTSGTTLAFFGGEFLIDPLASWVLLIISIISISTSIYNVGYIAHEHELTSASRRMYYYVFFNAFLASMFLCAVSNNIILLWAAIEATTIVSAFLVGIEGKLSSIEAGWKYLILCGVGVVFALFGTVLVYSDAISSGLSWYEAIHWSTLIKNADSLNGDVLKFAFVLILVGYGTKAGLAPLHAWLPDAHAEAPAPVSTLLSGVLLKCAILAIIRYYVLAVHAGIGQFSQMVLLSLGLISIVLSSLLILATKDIKRLFAYSSIENIGIIATCLGFGGSMGLLAAILHMLSHAVAKSMAFMSSGNIVLLTKTRNLGSMNGLIHLMPATSSFMLVSALIMAGTPPAFMFTTKFLAIKAGVDSGNIVALLLLVFGVAVAGVGIVTKISKIILGSPQGHLNHIEAPLTNLIACTILLAITLYLGLALPECFERLTHVVVTHLLEK
jgi:hydrogenase-4 component F